MSDIVKTSGRLLATIQAAVPAVRNVSIGAFGVAASVKVFPANQQTAAQATIDAFDWSDGAQATFDNLSDRASAKTLLNSSTVDREKLLRAVMLVMLDEINVLRVNSSLAARTAAQLKTAIQNKIDAGSAD